MIINFTLLYVKLIIAYNHIKGQLLTDVKKEMYCKTFM